MADNSTLDPGAGGDTYRSKDRAGVKTEIVGLDLNPAGSEVLGTGDATNGLDVDVTRVQGTVTVTGALTDTQLRATPVPVSGTVTASGPLTDTQLRATPVPVSGTVTASGPLTDTQLRASAVPVDTELPAAAALADGAANPTAPAVGAFALLWNGSTWDRCPGGATNGLTANLKALNGTTIATNSGNKDAGTQRVVLATDQVQLTNALKVDPSGVTSPVSNAGTFAVQIAANSSVNQAQVSGTATSVNSGTKDAGTQRVILASDQTVVPISDNSGSLTVDAPVGTPAFVTATPSATGGWSKIKYAAQTTTVVKPKGTAGTFGGYYAWNPNASAAYIQVFDLATATTVTLGTTVPDMIFGIPAGSAANLEITNGVNMALGMQLACTTTATGSTAPGTGLDLTVLFK